MCTLGQQYSQYDDYFSLFLLYKFITWLSKSLQFYTKCIINDIIQSNP